MIALNRNHPEFCLESEILASLPPAPARTSIRLLARDLGVNQKNIIAAVAWTRGVQVEVGSRLEGRRLVFFKAAWSERFTGLFDYLKRVYGENK